MVPEFELLLSVIGVAISVAGVLSGFRKQKTETRRTVNLWVAALVATFTLVSYQAVLLYRSLNTIGHIERALTTTPSQSIYQLKSDLILRNRSLNEIASGLEALLEADRIEVEPLIFNVTSEQSVTVEIYTLKR